LSTEFGVVGKAKHVGGHEEPPSDVNTFLWSAIDTAGHREI